MGGALSKALELEYGELAQEDQEFEIARRFVRIAGTAARKAALADPNSDLQTAAKKAVMAAAQRHVANLPANLNTSGSMMYGVRGTAQAGRWIRQGKTIVVLGAY